MTMGTRTGVAEVAATAHIHTATCWRDDPRCAEDLIARLYRRIYEQNIELAKAQNAIREVKSTLDKVEAGIARMLARDVLDK